MSFPASPASWIIRRVTAGSSEIRCTSVSCSLGQSAPAFENQCFLACRLVISDLAFHFLSNRMAARVCMECTLVLMFCVGDLCIGTGMLVDTFCLERGRSNSSNCAAWCHGSCCELEVRSKSVAC